MRIRIHCSPMASLSWPQAWLLEENDAGVAAGAGEMQAEQTLGETVANRLPQRFGELQAEQI